MKYKITVVIEVDAADIDEARYLASQFADRGNDSSDGEVGDVVAREVEEM
jgi:hypothetical protein